MAPLHLPSLQLALGRAQQGMGTPRGDSSESLLPQWGEGGQEGDGVSPDPPTAILQLWEALLSPQPGLGPGSRSQRDGSTEGLGQQAGTRG